MISAILDALEQVSASLSEKSEQLITRSLVPLAKALRRLSAGASLILIASASAYLSLLIETAAAFLWLINNSNAGDLALSGLVPLVASLLTALIGLMLLRAPRA